MTDDYLGNVRQQYEDFPYPPRDPADEKRRLLEVHIDRLATINFYCFQAKSDFTNARVLVAGGGTGDSAIYLAEQLRARGGQVVYVDISRASMDIARARAEVRKLKNIEFTHGSLLSLTPEANGQFDYISCTGVLHHLDDPALGLRRLASVLKPGGGMGVMIYAKYGRTGIYQIQHLMRLINGAESDLTEKIANTRALLGQLPETNWFRHNERLLSDHINLGDSGLVDLLLHEQDVAYSVDEVYELAAEARLNVVEFNEVNIRLAYRPETFIRDPALLARISKLDAVTQRSIGEIIAGAISKHSLYLSNRANAQARLGNLGDVPFFFPERDCRDIGRQIADAMRARPDDLLPLRHASGFSFSLAPEPIMASIFKHIDGVRNWSAIFAAARADSGDARDDAELLDYFRPTFEQFRQFDWLLLRGENVGAYPDTVDLQLESQRR